MSGQQMKLFGEDLVTEDEVDATADDTVEQIEPLGDQVLVLPVDGPGKTRGGILLPKGTRQDRETIRGRVLAVGTGVVLGDGTTRPIKVEIGQHVIFGKFAGVDIQIEGQDVKIVREGDIIAKVRAKSKSEPAALAVEGS